MRWSSRLDTRAGTIHGRHPLTIQEECQWFDRRIPPPFSENRCFLRVLRCALCYEMYGKIGITMFRGWRGPYPSDVWSLVKFHVFLWILISKIFYNYSLDNILFNWSPFLMFFFFLLHPCILLFFPMKVVSVLKKNVLRVF